MSADQYLSLPGARLRYRDAGAGAALVLVHGWTLDLEIWEPQLALAAQQRVLRYDRRGFGLSSGQPSLADDLTDLAALLAALDVVRPVLVGMSQGARVVLEFAARQPRKLAGLVLDGPPPLAPPNAEQADAEGADLPMAEFRASAARDGLAAFRKQWSAHPFTRLVTGDARSHELLAGILARYPGHDLRVAPPPGTSLDTRALAAIHTPTLIVNGAQDSDSRRRAGLRLCAAMPGAEHAIIENAAHLPNLDAPRDYNRLIGEFARRHLPVAA